MPPWRKRKSPPTSSPSCSATRRRARPAVQEGAPAAQVVAALLERDVERRWRARAGARRSSSSRSPVPSSWLTTVPAPRRRGCAAAWTSSSAPEGGLIVVRREVEAHDVDRGFEAVRDPEPDGLHGGLIGVVEGTLRVEEEVAGPKVRRPGRERCDSRRGHVRLARRDGPGRAARRPRHRAAAGSA